MGTPDAAAETPEARIRRLEAELAAERALWSSDATADRTSIVDPGLVGAPDAAAETPEARIRRLEAELAAERALWSSDATADRTSGGDPYLMHRLEALDGILGSGERIRAYAGLGMQEYGLLAELYDEEVERLGKAPMFRDEGRRASDPGNRRRLHRRHAPLLGLGRRYAGVPPDTLAVMFAIDGGAASRYLALDRRILERVLPTARTISGAIAACRTPGQVQEFIPGGRGGCLLLDRVRNPHRRPGDEWGEWEAHPGEGDRPPTDTLVGASKDGVIVWIGGTRPGGIHDARAAEELARAFPGMAREGGARIRVVADAGLHGIQSRLPGIEAATPGQLPPGGGPAGGQGEEEEEGGNGGTGGAGAGHWMVRTRDHVIMNRPYDGTPAEFNAELNIVTGLVNLGTLFPQIRRGTGVYGRLMAERRRRRLERPRRR